MPKAPHELFRHFKPTKYLIDRNGDLLHLTITGQKLGPPSRRISLHQTGLKVINAKVTRFDKHGPVEIEIVRINHLPTFQQVRLHAQSVMYPGRYQIELDYEIKTEPKTQLGHANPSRKLLPSIDETAAWQVAEVEFKP